MRRELYLDMPSPEITPEMKRKRTIEGQIIQSRMEEQQVELGMEEQQMELGMEGGERTTERLQIIQMTASFHFHKYPCELKRYISVPYICFYF